MTPTMTREAGLRALRLGFEDYCALEQETWSRLAALSTLVKIERGELLTRQGVVPQSFGFVCAGLLRGYASNEEGQEYNKVFFPERSFPGAMVALLTRTPSHFAIQALETSWVMKIDHPGYRRLLEQRDDLKWFQILYLEKNWLLSKEPREIALVQETATERYLRFQAENPGLEPRLAQFHVASHLGVTATQLSRIRRQLKAAKKEGPTST